MITSHDAMSIEHKQAWLNVSPDLFWDLGNIAFSHLFCNCGNHRIKPKDMTIHSATGYKYGCRCKNMQR